MLRRLILLCVRLLRHVNPSRISRVLVALTDSFSLNLHRMLYFENKHEFLMEQEVSVYDLQHRMLVFGCMSSCEQSDISISLKIPVRALSRFTSNSLIILFSVSSPFCTYC